MMTRREANLALMSGAVATGASPEGRDGLLVDALAMRRSTRGCADRPLPMDVMPNLLWSAFGINRPESDGRPGPAGGRHLAKTGTQDFVASATVNLVYVADTVRMGDVNLEEKRLYAFTDSGFIGQNVYLFCASEGLGSVFRASVDCEAPARTAGYPRA